MTGDDPLNFIEPRVAAGALFTDGQGRILMVVPTYKDYWDIPGGYVENGETPTQAVRREVFEELGIKPSIGRLLVVDWRSDSPENNGKAKLLLVFDGGLLSNPERAEIAVDGVEIQRAEFRPAASLDEVTIDRLSNRIRQAMKARHSARLIYLEDGLELSPQPDEGEQGQSLI